MCIYALTTDLLLNVSFTVTLMVYALFIKQIVEILDAEITSAHCIFIICNAIQPEISKP